MRSPHHASRLAAILVALLTLLATAPLAQAADSPDRARPEAPIADAAEAIQAPVLDYDLAAQRLIDRGTLQLLVLPPLDALDRGSSLTDAGLNRTGALNALERAKLDMARVAQAAVADRNIVLPAPPLPLRPADVEALKLERLSTQQPQAPSGPAVADGVGEDIASVQELGPIAPSGAELLKLEQIWPSQPNRDVPAQRQPVAEPEQPARTEDPEVQR